MQQEFKHSNATLIKTFDCEFIKQNQAFYERKKLLSWMKYFGKFEVLLRIEDYDYFACHNNHKLTEKFNKYGKSAKIIIR